MIIDKERDYCSANIYTFHIVVLNACFDWAICVWHLTFPIKALSSLKLLMMLHFFLWRCHCVGISSSSESSQAICDQGFSFLLLFLFMRFFSCYDYKTMEKIKSLVFVEYFWSKFNILLSIDLCFVDPKDVDPTVGNPSDEELFLSWGYFEVGVRLPFPLVFHNFLIHLHIAPYQGNW